MRMDESDEEQNARAAQTFKNNSNARVNQIRSETSSKSNGRYRQV